MERIAVVSDIHANLPALEAFLSFINRDDRVSRILNLGDFIQIGPNPTEVFDLVMADSRFISIMGNSEAMFFDAEVRRQYEAEAAHQSWVAAHLGAERMARLGQLPLHRTVPLGGRQLLMVHARMNSVMDAPLLYQGRPLQDFLSDYNTAADYVLIGHTHLPLYAVHWMGKPVINPGAVGCGKDGVVRFAMLEEEKGLISVTFHQLKYARDMVLADYERLHVPCADRFAAMFF